MIVWRGYGFIIFIIVFSYSLLTELISEALSGDDNFYQANLIPLGFSLICSALTIGLLFKYFTKKKMEGKGTLVFDKITLAQSNPHLFFIPFKYWSYILGIAGIGIILFQLFKKK